MDIFGPSDDVVFPINQPTKTTKILALVKTLSQLKPFQNCFTKPRDSPVRKVDRIPIQLLHTKYAGGLFVRPDPIVALFLQVEKLFVRVNDNILDRFPFAAGGVQSHQSESSRDLGHVKPR